MRKTNKAMPPWHKCRVRTWRGAISERTRSSSNRVEGRGSSTSHILRSIIIVLIILALPLTLAANDPGHDTLYVEETGNSQIAGDLNITQDLKVAQRLFGDYLDVRGDGTMSGSTNRIIGTATDLYIESGGDIYFNDQLGLQNTVYIGGTGDNVSLSVSGYITSGGVAVCLVNGTGCAGGTQVGNVTSVIAGNGISVDQTTGDVTVSLASGSAGTGLAYSSGVLSVNTGTGLTTSGDNIVIDSTVCTTGNGLCDGSSEAGGWTNTTTTTSTVLDVNIATGNLIVQSGDVGIGTTTPLYDLDVRGTIMAATGLPTNLIRDPYFSTTTFWSSSSGHDRVLTTLPTGESIKGLEVNTTGNVLISSDYIPVDRDKTYRFSIWMRSNNTVNGTRYFGMYCYNASKTRVNCTTTGGTKTTNPYFWSGDLSPANTFRKITGYLFPENTSGWNVPNDATNANFGMNNDTVYVRLRFLNYANDGAAVSNTFAMPRVEIVEKGDIWAVDTVGGSTSYVVLTPGYNVGIGTQTPGEKLQVVGNINASGDVCTDSGDCLSDISGLGGGTMDSWFINTDGEAAEEISDGETVLFSDSTGMTVERSGNTITFTNTGDTNAGDDLTTSTSWGGDLGGTGSSPTVDNTKCTGTNEYLDGQGNCDIVIDTNLTGSTAGGDLSGTYPNPAVRDDSHEHDAANITSGNLAVARLPTGGAWSLSSDLNIDSNKLVVDNDNNRVGIMDTTPTQTLDITGNIGISGTEVISSSRVGNFATGTTVDSSAVCTPTNGLCNQTGLPPTGTAGGDLSGTYPNPAVRDDSHEHDAANITSGTLVVARGGTGRASHTAYTLIAGGTTTTAAQQSLAAGSSGQILRSTGSSSIPAWSTATYPATTTANQLLYSSAANTVTGLTTGNSGVLVTSGAGVPSIATDIPTAVTIGSAYIYRAGGTDIPITDGGTGASDASTALSNLGAAATGDCAPGSVVMNTTSSGVECVAVGSGDGSVTSITEGTGMTFSTTPITVSGTINLNSTFTSGWPNWNTAYTHSQIAGGDSVHVSVTENSNWDTAYTRTGGATSRLDQAVLTTSSPQFNAINIGHASDTTITRTSAGTIAVEGNTICTPANGLCNQTSTPPSGTAGGDLSGSYPNPAVRDDSHEHDATNITSGNLAVARLPTGGAWSLSSDLNIDSNKLVVDNDNNRVGIMDTTPTQTLDITGNIGISGTEVISSSRVGNFATGTTVDSSAICTSANGLCNQTGLPPTGTAGGDLSGTFPNPAVRDDSHEHDAANITSGTLVVARGGTGATTLNDLITLGTHTTGAYVSTIATGEGTQGSGSGETSTPTISFDCSEVTDTAGDATACSGENIIVGAGSGLTASTTGLDLNSTFTSGWSNWDAAYAHVATDVIETAADVQAAETDADHDECSEISGCVVGATTNTGTVTSITQGAGTSFSEITISGSIDLNSTFTSGWPNWNDAYTHSQIAGGDSVHVSVTENSNWDTAYTRTGGATSRLDQAVLTTSSPQFNTINIGHASDTTITRTSAGTIAVEGNTIYRAGGTDIPITDGGTGASDAATALSNLGAAATGDCAPGSVVMNTTSSGVECVAVGSGDGSVTSISGGAGLNFSNNPITTTGTITINNTWLDANYIGQNEYTDLDTDHTDDLTDSTSWGGDLGGTGSSPTVDDTKCTGTNEYLDGTGTCDTLDGTDDQNLWETIDADTGSVAANIATDTLYVEGAGTVSTAISGDTLTITGTGDGTGTDDQNLTEVLTEGDTSGANQNLIIYDGSICADNAGTCAGSTDGYIYADALYVAGGTSYGFNSSGGLLAAAGSVSNTELANSAVTVTAGSGLTGGGSISLGGSTTLDLGALTSNWDAGSYEIRAQTFESDATTGTAPLTIASTTVVANLNADLLDGYNSSDFLTAGSGTYLPLSGGTMESGAHINWVDTGTYIDGTDTGITIESDDTLTANADTSMTFTTPAATFTGTLGITGDLTVSGDNIDSAGAVLRINDVANRATYIGSGTANTATGDNDFYVTGIAEIDEALDIDGTATFASTTTMESGATLTAASGSTVTIADGAAFNFNRVTGTSPFTVDSTTVVTNLNADTLDSHDTSYFQRDIGAECSTGQFVEGINNDGTMNCSTPSGQGNTTEQVEDVVGGMVTGNTETGIIVTYEDSDGTLDFVANDTSPTNELPAAGTDIDVSENTVNLETTIDSVTTINNFFDAACGEGQYATQVTTTGGYGCIADADYCSEGTCSGALAAGGLIDMNNYNIRDIGNLYKDDSTTNFFSSGCEYGIQNISADGTVTCAAQQGTGTGTMDDWLLATEDTTGTQTIGNGDLVNITGGSDITVERSGGNITINAADSWYNSAGDVIGGWSGTCNSGTFMRGDGSCQTVASAETDPQVGAVTLDNWCIGDGSSVECNQAAPITSEDDPEVGTLTSGRACYTTGSDVDCDDSFYWNSGSNYLGVGVNPSAELHIGGTTPELRIGDAGAEDTMTLFDGNAYDFHIGLDDSADDLVIGTGSTLGTNTIMTIENGGNVGIGTASPDYALTVVKAEGDGSSTQSAAHFRHNITAASTDWQVGGWSDSKATHSSGTVLKVLGSYSLAEHTGTGTVTNLVGSHGWAYISGEGTATTAKGLEASVTNDKGTLTTGYGLYINDIAGTTDYGIYQSASSDDNYFAGDVGIGTNPAAPLDVESTSNQFRLAYDSDSEVYFIVGSDSDLYIAPQEATGRITLNPGDSDNYVALQDGGSYVAFSSDEAEYGQMYHTGTDFVITTAGTNAGEVRIGSGGTPTLATDTGDLYVQDDLEVNSITDTGVLAVGTNFNTQQVGGVMQISGYMFHGIGAGQGRYAEYLSSFYNTSGGYEFALAQNAYQQKWHTDGITFYSGECSGCGVGDAVSFVEVMHLHDEGKVTVGTGTPTYVNGYGDFYVTNDLEYDGTLYGPGSDLAEKMPAKGEILAGTVVEMDAEVPGDVKPSSKAFSTLVAGVISTDPAMVLGSDDEGLAVALAGRVPVKVNNENGPIAIGDYLVTSSSPGEAMGCRVKELNLSAPEEERWQTLKDNDRCRNAAFAKAMETSENGGTITGLVLLN